MPNLVSWNTVTALWIAWLAYWFPSALGVRRNEPGESVGQRLRTALVLGVGGYLIFARSTPLALLNARFVPDSKGIQVVGLGMIVAGLAITIWARCHIGQFWSARVMLKEGHQLIQTGRMHGCDTPSTAESFWRFSEQRCSLVSGGRPGGTHCPGGTLAQSAAGRRSAGRAIRGGVRRILSAHRGAGAALALKRKTAGPTSCRSRSKLGWIISY